MLVGADYLTGYLLTGDRLPQRAVVSGVAVGALSRAEAIDRLTAVLDHGRTPPSW